MDYAIEVEALCKSYFSRGSAKVHALAGITFQLPAGHIYGLLGPNGSGKTTTVKVLATVASPTSGHARVYGVDVAQKPLLARQKSAVVLQQTASEDLLTIQDNLLIYAYLHGLSKHDARQRAQQVVDEFEIRERLSSAMKELSLGTKRRIQVAKLFMLDTPLLILDEATTGMDPMIRHRVMHRLRAAAREGRTVLLTTQVLSEAEDLCEQIIILDKGRTLASGTLDELRRRSAHSFRVSLSFGETSVDLDRLLRSLEPTELRMNGRSAELSVRGEESALLSKLAEVSRVAPIQQFEVRGPNLEEIFMNLVEIAR